MTAPALGQQHQSNLVTQREIKTNPPLDVHQGMIRLDVTVQDKSGNPVGGLTQNDFTLLDNGQPAKTLSFEAFSATAVPNPPVEVLLMIDELNISELQLTAEKHEAEIFLRLNNGHLLQPVTVYWLDKDGLSTSGRPSSDGNALADEISQGREQKRIWKTPTVAENLGKYANSGLVSKKPLHSLIALGSIAIEQRRDSGRKLMFWLGYGWQFERLASGDSTGAFDFLTEISTRLREARIDLWEANEWPVLDAHGNPIPVSAPLFKTYFDNVTPQEVSLGYLQLNVIATQTGGGLLTTSSGLAGLIAKHIEHANCFYSLTFDPPPANVVDEYHRLQLEMSNPDLAAHSWAGYFDQPVFYDQPRDDVERLTVAQLEQSLRAAHASSGSDQARLLSKIELTERLSSTEFAKLKSMLKNKEARQALVAVADQSVFLALPAQDIASTPAPDPATQQLIVSRTREYVSKTIPKLPDFFANRTIIQYQEPPPKPGQTWKTAMGDQSLYPSEESDATVLFRNGKEVVQGETAQSSWSGSIVPGITSMPPTAIKPGEVLSTVGTFGAVLNTVLVGAMSPESDLQWSRWETGPNGLEAVFRYRAPYESPAFVVGFTYLAADTTVSLRSESRFQGEFAVDPATGAVLRLTIQADLPPKLPLNHSDVMVEYSPVIIGGQTYICPTRSISIQRQRRIMDIHEWGEDFKVYAPFETLLNDMAYRKYHKFHSTARILPGYIPAPKDE
jgi:VWFA-related protein